nr:ACT domain-containing protein [Numidum massiliense]
MSGDEQFYLIRADILPEAIVKTVEAKKLLASGKVETVGEAVGRVGLSRSAFYKYKDGIYPFSAAMKEMIITVSMNLEHRSGVLSRVLSYVAGVGGNVLTINQTIPLQGMANVAMSIDTTHLAKGITQFLEELQTVDGVKRALIVGRSETI